MAYYLQMDGVDDYLKMPVVTMDSIEIDCMLETSRSIILDARAGLSNGHLNSFAFGAGWTLVQLDGSTITSMAQVPLAQRGVIKATAASFTDDVNFFSNNTNATPQKGRIYKITCKLAGAVVAMYDLTAGNVRDHSGNGYHATLSGGTFVAESTPTTIVSDSLAYYYNSKQGATTSQWDDLSGGGRHLTMTDITTIDPTLGYYFSTALSRGISPIGNLVPLQSTFTYEAAVTIPNLANTGWITLGYIGGTDSKGVSIGSTEILRVYDGGGSKVSTYTLPLSTTVIITIRRKSATAVSLFVNGVFHSDITTDLDVTGVTGRLIVGTDDGSGDLLGHIAFVRQYTRELTNAEIAENYSIGTAVGLSGSSGTTHNGAATLQGVSTISAGATLIPAAITGSASLQGVGILSAAATVTNSGVTASASLQGVGTLTANGSLIRSGSANMIGVSALSVSAAGLTVSGAASLIGIGSLVASGNSGVPLIGFILLSGEQVLSVSLSGERNLTATIEGSTNPPSVALEGGL